MALPRIQVSEIEIGDEVRVDASYHAAHRWEWPTVTGITRGERSSYLELRYADGRNAGRIRPRNDKRIVARKPSVPDELYDEEVAPRFARLLLEAAEEHCAPSFAAELATRGASAGSVRRAADEWADWTLVPHEFAGRLHAFADQLELLERVRRA